MNFVIVNRELMNRLRRSDASLKSHSLDWIALKLHWSAVVPKNVLLFIRHPAKTDSKINESRKELSSITAKSANTHSSVAPSKLQFSNRAPVKRTHLRCRPEKSRSDR